MPLERSQHERGLHGARRFHNSGSRRHSSESYGLVPNLAEASLTFLPILSYGEGSHKEMIGQRVVKGSEGLPTIAVLSGSKDCGSCQFPIRIRIQVPSLCASPCRTVTLASHSHSKPINRL